MFMVRMNDRKRGTNHIPVISLFHTTLSIRPFPDSSSQENAAMNYGTGTLHLQPMKL